MFWRTGKVYRAVVVSDDNACPLGPTEKPARRVINGVTGRLVGLATKDLHAITSPEDLQAIPLAYKPNLPYMSSTTLSAG